MKDWTVETHSPEETRRLASCLGSLLQPGDVVLLEGDLGAGKTHFAQGVAQGLGVEASVTSPTFTLIAEYDGTHPFVHMDLYRLYADPYASDATLHPEELAQLGVDDYLGGHDVVLIEWPKGVISHVEDHLHVRLLYPDNEHETMRRVVVHALGRMAEEVLEKWVTLWA